jgi:DNA polymerase-3 subunit delta'
MNLKTFSGAYRLVVIEDADRMNINAQNALLKTLEEPFPNAFIWLLTSHPKRLLPTVRSRCQLWSFFAEPDEAYAYFSENFPTHDPKLLWEQSHAGPLNILESLNQTGLEKLITSLKDKASPISLAEYYEAHKEVSANFILDTFYRWIIDWHRLYLGAELFFFKKEEAWFRQYPFCLRRLEKLKNLLHKIYKAKRARAENINLNLGLMLEDIFIDWIRI